MVSIIEGTTSFLPVIGTFFVVILILCLSYWVSKKIALNGFRLNQSKRIKVLDSIMLGQERSISIIQVGNRYFLIGAASSKMSMLAELTEDDIKLIDDGESPKTPASFKEILSGQKPWSKK